MRLLTTLSLALCIAAGLPACSKHESASESMPAPQEQAPGNAAAPVAARMIVRNARLTLVVSNIGERVSTIQKIAETHGGFVEQSSIENHSDSPKQAAAEVKIKVAAAQLDSALAALRALAVLVEREEISSEDITAEFVDVSARLKNLQAAEAQLQQIMNSAKSTEEVLAVFGQLTTIRGEIESVQARVKLLGDSARLSSIVIALQTDAATGPLAFSSWQPSGQVKQATETLVLVMQGLGSTAIWLLIVGGPVVLLVILPLRWLWRRWRRR